MDLPDLTRALVALFRGQAQAKTGFSNNLGFVRIVGLNVDLQILASDWAKIMPYIQDDSFRNLMSQRPANAVPLHPKIAASVPANELSYYTSVYHILYPLFT